MPAVPLVFFRRRPAHRAGRRRKKTKRVAMKAFLAANHRPAGTGPAVAFTV